MVVLIQSTSTNARALGRYMRDVPAHDESGQRFVYEVGVECTPRGWQRALRTARSDHGRQLKVEALHTILSYGTDEADPDDPDAGLKVLEDARAFAAEAFPGHASLVVVQKDGRSGLWHAHIATANVGHGPSKLYDGTVRPAGYALHESQRHVATSRRTLDEMLLRNRGFDNREHMRRHRGSDRTVPSDQRRRDTGEYVWRDDLKERISLHASSASSFDDFMERMAADGVIVKQRPKNKRGLAYDFTGQDGRLHHASAGGRNGLGSAFGYDGIMERLGQPVASLGAEVEQTAPAPVAGPEKASQPVPSVRASAPAPAIEPTPAVEEPVAATETDSTAEQLEYRREQVALRESQLQHALGELKALERFSKLVERNKHKQAYQRWQYHAELLRLFLEMVRPAADDARLPWRNSPTRGQKSRAGDSAAQLTLDWIRQGALVQSQSSIKRPSLGQDDLERPEHP